MVRSPISCSSLHRRKLCPGSAAAEAACPEVHTADSDMGTRLHGIMALVRDPDRWRGVVPADRLVCERADILREEVMAELEAQQGIAGAEFVASFEVEVFIEADEPARALPPRDGPYIKNRLRAALGLAPF